jgi:hypothetical protein
MAGSNDDGFDSKWSTITAEYRAAAATISEENLERAFHKALPTYSIRSVHLSGMARSGNYFVELDGINVPFSYVEFLAFAKLVLGRLEAGPGAEGHTSLLPADAKKPSVSPLAKRKWNLSAQKIISRVRDKIDESMGRPRLGHDFLLHVHDDFYCLRIPCLCITIQRDCLKELAQSARAELRDVLNSLLSFCDADHHLACQQSVSAHG